MSRTDAHRPAWVQQFDPTVPASIHHDHARGECTEETFEYARWRAGHGWARNHVCKKHEWIDTPCEHDYKRHSPVTSPCYRIRSKFRSWELLNPTMADRIDNPWVLPECTHRVRVRHDDWPCHCDDWPRTPTCDMEFDRRYSKTLRYYRRTSVPKWYVDHTWNNPERVRVRDRLREAAKSYNAGEDLEDYDFPHHQHHHRSSWHWY